MSLRSKLAVLRLYLKTATINSQCWKDKGGRGRREPASEEEVPFSPENTLQRITKKERKKARSRRLTEKQSRVQNAANTPAGDPQRKTAPCAAQKAAEITSMQVKK